jgi:hypothetical protein
MKKQALLIGINNYQTINGLQGCINDVTNVRDILKSFFGFTNNDIRVLTDERETKANILSRLENMVTEGKPGDLLIFQFSGHGSQVLDRENDELKDHMDELICPYDMNWDDGFITDDMLGNILSKLKKGVRMEIMLDSCHSGTGTRDINSGMSGGISAPRMIKNRCVCPPVDIECRYQGEEDKLKPKKAFRTDQRIILNHVLWAGCRDNQTSADAEIAGYFNGAFSYYFCKHIRDNKGNIARDNLCTLVKNSLKFNKFDQVPQLECVSDLKAKNVFSL